MQTVGATAPRAKRRAGTQRARSTRRTHTRSTSGLTGLLLLLPFLTPGMAAALAPGTVQQVTTGSGLFNGGRGFTCALDTAGDVTCWGGRILADLVTSDPAFTPQRPYAVPGLPSPMAQVDAGGSLACGVSVAGAAFCWGLNTQGQLGNPASYPDAHARPVVGLGAGVVSISAGGSFACAVVSSGAVYCWGEGSHGELGQASLGDEDLPVLVSGVSNQVEVSAGLEHACSRDAAGAVHCWGANDDGQLGLGTFSSTELPTLVSLPAANRVDAGRNHTCALLTDASVRCWGDNDDGQLGDASNVDRAVPTAVSGLASTVSQVVAGGRHSCALHTDGTADCWGDNGSGGLGDGTLGDTNVPVDVVGQDFVSLDAAVPHTCAVTTSQDIQCWGSNNEAEFGLGYGLYTFLPMETASAVTDFVELGRGGYGNCGVTSTDAVRCFGGSRNGVETVSGLATGVVDLANSGRHSCAIDAAGAVWCWGSNDQGQLGNNSLVNSETPVAVQGLPAAAAIRVAAGTRHSCAIVLGGDVWCWGRNRRGQLGDGTIDGTRVATPSTAVPQPMAEITAGWEHTCGLSTTGDALCWGMNSHMELGYGGTGTAPQPPGIVPNLPVAVREIMARGRRTCAELVDDSFWCWGRDDEGQLGDGVPTPNIGAPPTPLPTLPGTVKEIAMADFQTCALLTDGNVYCWGESDQIGVYVPVTYGNVRQIVPTPQQVAISGVDRLFSAGPTFTADASGNVSGWGVDIHVSPGGQPVGWSPIPVDVTPVPEPDTLLAIAIGVASLAVRARRTHPSSRA